MMGKSQCLSLDDVRGAFRLLGECRELGCDPRAWRLRLCEGLCALLHCQLAIGVLASWPRNVSSTSIELVAVGWPSDLCRRRFGDYMRDLCCTEEDLISNALTRPRPPTVLRLRPQLADDRRWHSSMLFNEYRRVGDIDDCLNSAVDLAGGLTDVISLSRALRDRPFRARDASLLELLHAALRPLLGTSLRIAGPSARDLPPHLRHVLTGLLRGDSEKQVARSLGLTPMSVHQYVKAVYRQYG